MERTKHRHKFNPLALLLGVFISSFGAVNARANTIAALTGTFDYYGSDAMEGGFVNDGVNVWFSLGETITFAQPQCDQWGDCTIPFSGRPLGGSMVASFQNNTTITLTPFDMTGSISGVLYTTDWAESGCMQVDSYSFRGLWSNGWLSAVSGADISNCYDYETMGGLTIVTQTTPEPASLSLFLGGMATAATIAFRRLRCVRS